MSTSISYISEQSMHSGCQDIMQIQKIRNDTLRKKYPVKLTDVNREGTDRPI